MKKQTFQRIFLDQTSFDSKKEDPLNLKEWKHYLTKKIAFLEKLLTSPQNHGAWQENEWVFYVRNSTKSSSQGWLLAISSPQTKKHSQSQIWQSIISCLGEHDIQGEDVKSQPFSSSSLCPPPTQTTTTPPITEPPLNGLPMKQLNVFNKTIEKEKEGLPISNLSKD